MIFQTYLEFVTFVIFVLGMILGIFAITLMFKHYRKYHHQGLLILTIANVFATFAAFAHVGHLIFHDKKYEGFITNLSAVMISMLITGTYLSIIGYNNLIENRSTKRILSLAPIYLLGLLLNAVVIKHEYHDEKWQVVYHPDYAFYLFSACVVIIQVDLYLLLFSMVKYTKIQRVRHIFYVTSVAFFSLVPLLFLRKFITLPQNILLLPISFFYLLFTILLTFYPLVFFSSTASPFFLVIVDSQTNLILRQYTFLEPANEERSEQILSHMIDFYNILQEGVFSNDIKQIHLRSLNYYFETKYEINYILVLDRPSESFKMLLFELSQTFSTLSRAPRSDLDFIPLDQIDQNQIELSIDRIFIHQLVRLKLVRQDIDESTHDKIIEFIEKNQSMKLILHPIRLSIIQILNENNIILRSELTKMLEINSGTLQRHLETLKEAKYIDEDNQFVDDKPRKSIIITQQGRADYSLFRRHMKSITQPIHQ